MPVHRPRLKFPPLIGVYSLLGVLLASLVVGLTFARQADAARMTPPPPPPRCAAPAPERAPAKPPAADSDATPPRAEATDVWTDGSVTVGGAAIDYCAVAGTLVVHPKDWDDTASKDPSTKDDTDDSEKKPTAQASMFYVAYLRRGGEATSRPITFLFNGGPGTATVWLHMGAFGPRRVDTADAMHSAPAPYHLVNNDQSLLDASDLVFIDAPGTGFSRISGPDKEKSFYGIDEDAHAFAEFITAFLSKYRRWNSPKYLFGESYGTTRAAVLVNMLQDNPGVDFNGVIMLSQVLASDLYPDQPNAAPGNDLPFLLTLPTYAATAWYHNQPPDHRSTQVPASLLSDVERFAMGDYAAALAAGASLDPTTRENIVAKLHEFSGLSADYLRRADLRVSPDEFRQELLRDRGLIVGGTDTRFEGHTMDRMSRQATYDPSDAAIGSAYVSSFNDYVRRVLKYGDDKSYRPSVDDIGDKWSFVHVPPDASDSSTSDQGANVIPDLAHAMKTNPLLKVQLNSGYFDLLTPYFQGKYEMRHLPIPPDLRTNIEYRCYRSGHMVYLAHDALAQLHDNVAGFIERTSNLPQKQARPRSPMTDCASDR
ncbi:MAG: peptidase S10 [Acetobacteraceae bacterium]|jgi:carboxypeptidase C (cathepsin A)